MSEYLIWSNEHHAWWGPERSGYGRRIDDAGRYTRKEALAICRGARGGRRYNRSPSEVPVLLADAAAFWPDDRPEWEAERARREEDRQRRQEQELRAIFAMERDWG